jgi:hypothetical protein
MGGSFDDLKKLSSARKSPVDSLRPRLRKTDATENDDALKDDSDENLKEEEEEEEFEFNEQHALTLTGLSGKRLKRELSRHQLFQGLEDTQSPETTPGGTLTMETAQTLAMETDLIQDAKVVSGAGGRDDYLYQQKLEEESGSNGNNNNNASGNGGGDGMQHAPSLAQIFGTANAAGNNSSSPAGMERSSSPSLSPQHKQMLREYTMNKNKEQLSNNNNNNSNNNNNEKNKSSATNLQHANTLSVASSKFLAEEIRHMRDDPSKDKKTKTKKSKSTTIIE